MDGQVEYELTEIGASLVKRLRALSEWAQRHQPEIEAARAAKKSE